MDVDDAPCSSQPVAGPSASKKPPAKVSCLQCRAAKRKCNTPDANTTCRRCQGHGLACQYTKHRRGRKKKVLEGNQSEDRPSSLPHDHPVPRSMSSTADIPNTAIADAEVGGLFGSVPAQTQPSSIPPISQSAHHASAVSDVPLVSANESTSFLSGQTDAPSIHKKLPHEEIALTGRRTNTIGRFGIHYSHVIPNDGDSSPFVGQPASSSDALTQDQDILIQRLRPDCPDPVRAGLLTDQDAFELFEFYFRHLNATVAMLDPVIHSTTYCRHHSPLLFTAVLTVTARIIRPEAYAACLLLANKFVGQAVEFGLCSIEIVQALNLLAHWKKPDDETSFRRVGLAIHHSLPRMIKEDVDDPADWVLEHLHLPTPGESSLGPLVTFSRMCRLYADSLGAMCGDSSDMRMLGWIELEWKRWRKRWLEDNERYNFLQSQISTFRLCDSYFRFHICEYRLLFTARYEAPGQALDTSQSSPLSVAFSECVDAALGVAMVVQNDFVPYGYLPYCFNLTWIALAVNCIWLIKNIAPMTSVDRARVIRTLSDLQFSIEEASCSSQDMAAYTHRLLKHLLSGVSPEWQLASFMTEPYRHTSVDATSTSQHAQQKTVSNPGSTVAADQTSPQNWAASSAQEIIQEYLWSHPTGYAPPAAGAGPMNATSLEGAQTMGTIPGIQRNKEYNDIFPADDDDFW
ncbi:Hypothetical Protein CGB_A9550C [Cryptococcus gattii WM276]|uniref:Zn(2)-C6 fungal-type domain-containing protein n=1 Tax=Cryptococcus gattii serotype B (strain WM276 / ATCC MYA-4071) TaxID=367775 RepID=E6QYT8_CRYGW|nr:Hypothetical Protein CGB_A9550C [Cryptococcus gattii WM276]ADV19990.1 Hypothetical Protein CGB_A9550C [Cryptococcus gattii WM276]